MKNSARKVTWASVGCALAMLLGNPVLADDTELLLATPGTNSNPFNANILLIIDSSGSMNTLEQTIEPYDGTATYVGTCDATKLYWTQLEVTPTCDATNTQLIDKAAYVCKLSDRQIDQIGLYSDTMVQYRVDSSGAARWETLEPGNSIGIVECKTDSGFDGGLTSAAGAYAQAGANVSPYTKDAMMEISWGSYPTSESYTVYDGNYLNWKENPVLVNKSRIDIVKIAIKTALSAINSSNIAIMRFNSVEGGPVILGMTDLDSSRAAIDGVIDAILADGRTPLAETMYEAALYWLGAPAHYGELINEHPTDPNALITIAPEVYAAPTSPVCTKNYNILLTDGEPTDDIGAQLLAPTLPDFATKLGRSSCTGVFEGDCLDDITEYLSIPDLSLSQQGDQAVTTHTIGFAINLPILESAAVVSGGNYYLADNVESLTLALLQIFDIANRQALSFSAPSVAVNAFNRTQNRNELYMTVFSAESKIHWPGNLKKYRIEGGQIVDANGQPAVDPLTGFFADAAQSVWTVGGPDGAIVKLGGAANQQPDPVLRKLYTNNGVDNDLTAAANAISVANVAAFTLADFGLTGSAGEPTKEQIIDWARGDDIRDEDNDPATLQRHAMGDPLHAQPAAVDYGDSSGNANVVIFSATNDGYLHAIDGATGVELWSFIPKNLISNLGKLYFNASALYKNYGIDGDVVPIVADNNENGFIDAGDFVYLVFGMRRGGDDYYALDVTDKDVPKLLWQASFPVFGQSWSAPTITRVNISDPALNTQKAVVIIGAGYDSVHDTATFPSTADAEGAGIFMLDLATGVQIWRAGTDVGADLQLAGMTRSFPTRVKAIDLDGNRIADRMYATDVGGQVWRFDLFPGEVPATAVTGGVIAQLGAEGLNINTLTAADTRRIYNAPDIALFNDPVENRRFLSVSVGTGYRAHPLNNDTTDRFYSMRDSDVFNKLTQAQYDGYIVATDTDFIEVSGTTQAVVQSPFRGWKFTLPPEQKILADSATFDGDIFFVSFSPDVVAAADCQIQVGRNFLYRVSVVNGDPLVNNLDSLADSMADAARVTALQQGGIAPAPRFLFPSPDDPSCTTVGCASPPIACVGVECFDPGFRNFPVRTLWTQDGIE
jgi:type IV pilus assembly protein PilY1